jgi:hypothetical protein
MDRVILKGMRGEDVRFIQKCLNLIDLPGIHADGIYGRLSEARMLLTQDALKVPADGVLGLQSRLALATLIRRGNPLDFKPGLLEFLRFRTTLEQVAQAVFEGKSALNDDPTDFRTA